MCMTKRIFIMEQTQSKMANGRPGRSLRWFLGLLLTLLISQSAFSQTKTIVDNAFFKAKKFQVLDLDGDKDIDIVGACNDSTASPNYVIWWRQNSNGTFTRFNVSTTFTGARSAIAVDIAGDSRREIVASSVAATPLNITRWSANNTPPAGSWSPTALGSNPDSTYSVFPIDIDGDSDIDILFSSFGSGAFNTGEIAYYRNDGSGSFSRHSVDVNISGPGDAVAGDLDGDGDIDVVSTSFFDNQVAYYDNNGSESFTKTVLTSSFGGVNVADICDLDGDGDLDIIAGAYNDGDISWWENTSSGGTISFATEDELRTGFARVRSVSGVDIDGDTDIDIIATSETRNEIILLTNDGSVNFTETSVVDTFNFAYFATAADMDGDGDGDVIGSGQQENQIAFWESSYEESQTILAGDAAATNFYSGDVSIDFSAGTLGDVTVFYNANAVPDRNSLDTGIDHVAEKGFYTITTTKTGYTASADFYYGAANVAEWSAITDENDLVICLWDATNNEWVSAGTSQTVNTASDFVTVNGITADFARYSCWTLGSTTTDNPLPVSLLAFAAENRDEGVIVHWTTASEINNVGFEVWRSSDAAGPWELQANYLTDEGLLGAGNSNAIIDYSYLDEDVQDGNRYFYQLVDVDVNNLRTVHGPIEIFYENTVIADGFILRQNYPNPFNGVTRIPLVTAATPDGRNSTGFLAIYDMLGREIKRFDLDLAANSSYEIQWDGRNAFGQQVASGQYIYQVVLDGTTRSRKLQYVR